MNLEATRWRRQASEDLKTAQILFDSQRYGPCAFFCQQAAEKMLKAVIYNAEEKPWGHSVPSLLDQACAILQIEPGKAPAAEAEGLDEHYIRPRYPDARSGVEDAYDRETAEDALRQARVVCAFVEEILRDA
jgi:HEPN domain-containing protein